VDFRQIAHSPVPLWLATVDLDKYRYKPPLRDVDLWEAWPELMRCEFRGVSIDRLETILRIGVDVEPPDSVIYVSDFDKAWEYGGFPKLVLAFKCDKLRRTHATVPADTPPEELSELTKTFPTVVPSIDGESLYLSRLAADDTALGTEYEWAYAYWIPGDPFDALVAALVFAPPAENHVAAAAEDMDDAPGDSRQAATASE
jgi:hypothetical protein